MYSLLVPSLVTLNDLAPSFRVLELDTETFEVMDVLTYFADPTKPGFQTNRE